jgi:hypothetical protein
VAKLKRKSGKVEKKDVKLKKVAKLKKKWQT